MKWKLCVTVYRYFFSVFDLWSFLSLCWFLLSARFQTLKTKQGMLKEDWEFFKQRRFIEEQVRHVIMTLSFYNGVLQLCPSKRCNGSCFLFFCSYPTVRNPPPEKTTSQTLWECCHLVWVFQTVQTAITEEGELSGFSGLSLSGLELRYFQSSEFQT